MAKHVSYSRLAGAVIAMKTLIRALLKKVDIGIMDYANLQRLVENSEARDKDARAQSDIEFLLRLSDVLIPILLRNLRKSKSELRQDLFALSELNLKKNGYFVEFGATNGVTFSNTYLLEKEFGWTGILAEPAECWHGELKRNRNCHIETRCVWSNSDSILNFNEVDIAALSTIDDFSSNDLHKMSRTNGKKYEVRTISLLDLLDHHGSPREIDYLSIDTEGSEFAKLRIR